MKKFLFIFVGLSLLSHAAIAVDPSIKRKAFIEKERLLVTRLLDVISDIRNARLEYDANGLSGTFIQSDFTDSGNDHLTPTEFANVIVSEQAITDLLAFGGNAHYTNLYKIVR